jgi:GTPase
LISDTVGFVRDLPHHLVASFKATLEEATHADMLLLMLDVSHPHAQQQLQTVVQVLRDIGCEHLPTLLILNKIDALREENSEFGIQNSELNGADQLAFWKSMFPDALAASAKEGEGIAQLMEVVRDQMLGRTLLATIAVPLSDPKGITFIEKFTTVLERDYEGREGSVSLQVEISQRILDQLPNNVPSAKVVSAKVKRAGAGGVWRCRTKPIKELIPEGFLDNKGAAERAEAFGVPGAGGVRPASGGLTVGRKRLT